MQVVTNVLECSLTARVGGRREEHLSVNVAWVLTVNTRTDLFLLPSQKKVQTVSRH